MWRLGEAAHRCPHPPSLLFVAHTPPHFLEVEHLLWGHRQKACFDLRQVLDVRGEPARTRLPRHGKEACHPTQAPALSANPQHAVVLGLPRGWLWLAHARRATVLAMVLSIPTTIGSLFDDLCPRTDTAEGCHRFLNPDPNSPSSLPTYPPPAIDFPLV